MALVKCPNCGNFAVGRSAVRVDRGGFCEDTPTCEEVARHHRSVLREEANAYAKEKARRKAIKNARNEANRVSRAMYNKAVASGELLKATRKMGETK